MSWDKDYLLSGTADGYLAPGVLCDEINSHPSIVPGVVQVIPNYPDITYFRVELKGEPSDEGVVELDSIVSAHHGLIDPNIPKTVRLDAVHATKSGSLLATPIVSVSGYQLCDRDLLLCTSILGDDAFEDLKVELNGPPHSYAQIPWNELKLVGVYKDRDDGSLILVDDQADADAHATLSVYDYAARDPRGNLIPYEIAGGGIIPDKNLVDPQYYHRIYVVGAPDLAAYGFAVRFFDGYLCVGELGTVNPDAKRLDPSLAPGASIVRIFIYYPAGAKQNHLLRLRTYRQEGTF